MKKSSSSRNTVSRKPSMNPSDYNYRIKVIIVGNSGVGKTSLLQRMDSQKDPLKTTPTIDGIYHRISQKIEGNVLHLAIWDTAGAEAFRSVARINYRGASCAMVVYDVTQKSTFEGIPMWMEDLNQHCNNTDPVRVLVANKCDLTSERVVSREEGQSFAKKHHMEYVETTALDHSTINNAFTVASQQIYHQIKIGKLVPNTEKNGIRLGTLDQTAAMDRETEKKGCSC